VKCVRCPSPQGRADEVSGQSRAISAFGTSRHFAALQNLVAIGGIADIEQAAPIKLD
jgi:hypothetical protein